MRSMMAIINLVVDGEITTKEQAAAIVSGGERIRPFSRHHHSGAARHTPRKYRLRHRVSVL